LRLECPNNLINSNLSMFHDELIRLFEA
jgi:hypothetical protein